MRYNLEEELEKLNKNSSLKDIQIYINKMIETRGFENETPQDIMLLLTEELGELAKEVRKSTNIKLDSAKPREIDISGEIADVFIYILSLCRVEKIDLLEATKEKEQRNIKRTWE